jgi:ferredoxin
MQTEIYYFSGTGNSLFVARELQKRIPNSSLIPIVSLLHKDAIKSNAETVGFVFPIHGMTIPVPVKKFIKNLDVSSAKYLFAIATRGGTIHNAFTIIDKILKKKGKGLDSHFSITIFTNDPKLEDFEIPTKEQIEEMEMKIQTQLDAIQKIIQNKEISKEKDIKGITFPYNRFINFMLEKIIHLAMKYLVEMGGLNDYFYADEKCVGCGTCEKVCLSKKIKLVDKKPVWQNNIKCHFCYACLNFCPKKAVQIKDKWYMKSYTQTKGRYPHPFATIKDIINEKS